MQEYDSVYVKKYLEGSDEALRFLVGKYIQPLYRFALSYTKDQDSAEDIVQETFVKMWKHLETFDQSREFRPWLFEIARNTIIDWARKRKDLPLPEDLHAPIHSFDTSLAHAIQQAPKYKDILTLKASGFTFEEIAQKTEKPLNTVKSQYRRAIETLRKLLT